MPDDTTDLFIIGGVINGHGIARDAVVRGLTMRLAKMGDPARATSPKSTKLFHGGLRCPEYVEIRLGREALREREILLRAMPHIGWPLRFALPPDPEMTFESHIPVSRALSILIPWKKRHRPNLLIRAGLSAYDSLDGRRILPATTNLLLTGTPEGKPPQDRLQKACEYRNFWVENARPVALNACDAALWGTDIMAGARVAEAARQDGLWRIALQDGRQLRTRALFDAGGPCGARIIHDVAHPPGMESVRLVRGSHIVTRRLYDHNKARFFQGRDGRIILANFYAGDFTLIGTTDRDHDDPPMKAVCTPGEQQHLCDFASEYFKTPVTRDQIVWTCSGVRPLYDDGATSATAARRDYVRPVDSNGAPCLNVLGGKITTYRSLVEHAIDKLATHFDCADPTLDGEGRPARRRFSPGRRQSPDRGSAGRPSLRGLGMDHAPCWRLWHRCRSAARRCADCRGSGPRFRRHSDQRRTAPADDPRVHLPGRGCRPASQQARSASDTRASCGHRRPDDRPQGHRRMPTLQGMFPIPSTDPVLESDRMKALLGQVPKVGCNDGHEKRNAAIKCHRP